MEDNYKLNYFNFKKLNDEYLLTNDAGKFVFLTKNEFKDLMEYKIDKHGEIYKKLNKNYFVYDIYDELFIKNISEDIRKYKNYLFKRTQLHIFVLTVNCNMNCIYCQASVKDLYSTKRMMSKEIAEKAVDIALQSPSRYLSFEFQGGEPLLNFGVLKHIVEYTKSKNVMLKKDISFNLVSNLTVITNEIIDYLISNNISISTSIDGNSDVHDYNRPLRHKSSLNIVEAKIKKINDIYTELGMDNRVQAIQTTTKKSLRYFKEIIDEYVKLGINNIFLRPLTPIGFSINNWNIIGYEPDEFCEFYEKALDYIIELYLKGINIKEIHASIFLKKILSKQSINYMELRSPCGGAIGQLAYNYDGNIYTCDEGRMLAESGDESFKLGNVFVNRYEELIDNPITKSICVSSCLELLPKCSDCVYNPYCGTCPVYNYIEQKSIFGKMPISYKCKIYKGILELLFNKIQTSNKKVIDVFNEWVNSY